MSNDLLESMSRLTDSDWLGSNPLSPQFRADPYPGLKSLREKDPVNLTPIGVWRLTKYNDINQVFKNLPVAQTLADGSSPNFDPLDTRGDFNNFMLNLDGPEHLRLRRLVIKAFTGSSVKLMEKTIEEVVASAMKRGLAAGGMDICTDLAVDLKRYDYVDRLTNQVIPMECFVIRRHIFDHFLFTEMRAAGVEAEEGFQVKELLYDSGAVVGVRGRAGNGEIAEYRAPLVLGCDGFNSIVSRQAGLYKHESRHWLVALRCYYENVAGMDDQIELHYLREVEPGYFWIFPLENGYANVGIGMVHKFLKKRRVDLKQALADVVSSPAFRDRFADARPLEEPVGWNLPAGSKRRTVHADGVMLLGDAASLIDPFTGEGIGNALYSARTAVETAVAAGEAGDYSARFLKCYGNRLWDALGDELKISTRMQQLARRKSLLNLVIDRAAGDPEMEELFSGMIANALPKRRFVNPLFYLKLLFR